MRTTHRLVHEGPLGAGGQGLRRLSRTLSRPGAKGEAGGRADSPGRGARGRPPRDLDRGGRGRHRLRMGRVARGHPSAGRQRPDFHSRRCDEHEGGPHTRAGGGEGRRGPAGPSMATGCQRPGSWARWGTRAGYSPRSCCTEPPEKAGSAKCPRSTLSAPSGNFRRPPGRSCAPAGKEGGNPTKLVRDRETPCSRPSISYVNSKMTERSLGKLWKMQRSRGSVLTSAASGEPVHSATSISFQAGGCPAQPLPGDTRRTPPMGSARGSRPSLGMSGGFPGRDPQEGRTPHCPAGLC